MATTNPSTGSTLGPLIRMRALKISELPTHPDKPSSQQISAPDLQTFVSNALKEAQDFMTFYLPEFESKNNAKESPPSTARVALSSKEIKASDLPKEARDAGATSNETWFARTSIHDNEAREGTATWEEFDEGLRVDHSQHEKDYTPNVQDAHEALNWNNELAAFDHKIGDWEDIHVSILEMQHKIPFPLNNRVFPVLVITAKKTDNKEFIVVQIPVATRGLPNAKYHNVPKITGGMYCSIEHGKLVEDGKKVQWRMATASDAKGSLPMWAQKMGVPGAVMKDVGLFIEWVAKRRKGEGAAK